MSCERQMQEHEEAAQALAAAVDRLKKFDAAMFGSQSPPPILLSDQDVELLDRLEAEEREAAQTEQETARAYEEARRGHQP